MVKFVITSMISIRVFRKCTASIICTFGSILQHKIVNYCLRNHFLTRDQCFRQIQLLKLIFFCQIFSGCHRKWPNAYALLAQLPKMASACWFFIVWDYELFTLKVYRRKQGKWVCHLLVCCIVAFTQFKVKSRRIISDFLLKWA